MDLQEFAGFAIWALLLCCPLLPIYLTLKSLDWNQRKKLFLDSWFVYLSWLVSSLLVGLFTIYFDSFRAFWIILVIVNTFAVAITLSWTGKAERTANIFDNESGENLTNKKQKIWRTSIFLNIITILTMFALFSIATGIDVLIKKFNPKPKTDFEFYDI